MIGPVLVMWLLCEKHELANWVATVWTRSDLGCVGIACVYFSETGHWSLPDYKNKTSPMASGCDTRSDGCLHRRKASRASCAASEGETRTRSPRGRRSSEDGLAPLGLSLHCDLWSPTGEGPVNAGVGDSVAGVKGFYTSVIMFVITQQDRQWSTTQDLFFTDGQKYSGFSFFFFPFFPPQTLWLRMWKATPCPISMQCGAPLRLQGSAWCSCWWVRMLQGDAAGGGVSVQSHQTCSDVNIHLMDLQPKPSCLRFRLIQNVVFMHPRVRGNSGNILHESGLRRTRTPFNTSFCGLNVTKVRNTKRSVRGLLVLRCRQIIIIQSASEKIRRWNAKYSAANTPDIFTLCTFPDVGGIQHNVSSVLPKPFPTIPVLSWRRYTLGVFAG